MDGIQFEGTYINQPGGQGGNNFRNTSVDSRHNTMMKLENVTSINIFHPKSWSTVNLGIF